MSEYILDYETGVHIRPGKKGIGYANGGERKLLQILSSVADRSTFSEELLPHMSDWPTEYHLSRKRHLILRSLNISPGDRVLELGCGCGAITRYLLEAGAKVTAVEGELSRAAVAAKRCEGFDTVQFIADDFLNINLNNQYDWVLMIGVFEYSQKYGISNDRQAEYLNIARRHLGAKGTLVIAIENKLGIKYLNGAGEDHNGKLHYGPHDLYEGNDITTWGRKEIRDILIANGFAYQHFSGVFPDYKLPKIILDETIDSHRDFRAEELLHYCRSIDYREMNQRFFDESLLAGSLRKNGLLIDMANSLLITAKISESQPVEKSDLAVYYAVDRKSNFCTETKFFLKNRETKVVKHKLKTGDTSLPHFALATTPDGAVIKVEHDVDTRVSPYHQGELLGQAFTKAIKRNKLHQAGDQIHNWVAYLVAHFRFYSRTTGRELTFDKIKGRELSNLLIDGESLDCGPQNIVTNTEPQAFDLEWKVRSPIPLAWQITRNCQHILRTGYGGQAPVNLTQLVGLTSDYLGVIATIEDVEKGLYIEKQFQEAVGYTEPTSLIKLSSIT